jgi:hypothetical protein
MGPVVSNGNSLGIHSALNYIPDSIRITYQVNLALVKKRSRFYEKI